MDQTQLVSIKKVVSFFDSLQDIAPSLRYDHSVLAIGCLDLLSEVVQLKARLANTLATATAAILHDLSCLMGLEASINEELKVREAGGRFSCLIPIAQLVESELETRALEVLRTVATLGGSSPINQELLRVVSEQLMDSLAVLVPGIERESFGKILSPESVRGLLFYNTPEERWIGVGTFATAVFREIEDLRDRQELCYECSKCPVRGIANAGLVTYVALQRERPGPRALRLIAGGNPGQRELFMDVSLIRQTLSGVPPWFNRAWDDEALRLLKLDYDLGLLPSKLFPYLNLADSEVRGYLKALGCGLTAEAALIVAEIAANRKGSESNILVLESCYLDLELGSPEIARFKLSAIEPHVPRMDSYLRSHYLGIHAKILSMLGEIEKAEDLFEASIRVAGKSARIDQYLGLIASKMTLQKYTEALELIGQISKRFDSSVALDLVRTRALVATNNNSLAVDQSLLLLAENPASRWYWRELGLLLFARQ